MEPEYQTSPQPFPRPSAMTLATPPPLVPPPTAYQAHDQSRPSTGTPNPSWNTPDHLTDSSHPYSLPSGPTTVTATPHWSTFPQSVAADAFGPYTPASNGNPSFSPLMATWPSPDGVPFSSSAQGRPCGPIRTQSSSLPSRQRASTLSMTPLLLSGSPMQTLQGSYSAQSSQDFQLTPQLQPTTALYQSFPYSASASMSPIPPNSFSPVVDRRLSSPASHTGSYGTHNHSQLSSTLIGSGQRIHPAPQGLDLMYEDQRSENKQARFKPTKDQLAILIASYNQNKNPDAAARDALARQLGPKVRSKTLQIWFQNRRSKSRAKERESVSASQRSLSISNSEGVTKAVGAFDPFVPEGSGRKGSLADLESLKAMTHDDDTFLHIVPISVLSISTWTRFLTPGLTAVPDLCLGLRLLCPTPEILLYVFHATETYRISIPLVSAANDGSGFSPTSRPITAMTAAANPTLNTEAMLVRFELGAGVCSYACWNTGAEIWAATGDFSGGVVSGGGKVEITGQRETLLPAFAKVHQLLYDAPLLTPVTFTHRQPYTTSPDTPTPASTAADSASLPRRLHPAPSQTVFASSWRFPTPSTATSANNTPTNSSAARRNEMVGMRVRADGMGHAKQRSLSAPIGMPAEYEAGRDDLNVDMGSQSMGEELAWTHTAQPTNLWSGVGSVFGAQQSPYHGQPKYENPLQVGSIHQGWPYQYEGNVGPLASDYHQQQSASSAGHAAVFTPSLPVHPVPTTGMALDYTSHPSLPSHTRRERGDSAFSMQSSSSSDSMIVGGEVQAMTPPFVFDALIGGLEGAGGYSGEAKERAAGRSLGGMDMEVLDDL